MDLATINDELFLLSFVEALDVTVILQIRAGCLLGPRRILLPLLQLVLRILRCCYLLCCVVVAILIAVEGTGARRPSTVIPVHVSGAGDGVLLVVLVLVAALYQVLFGFFESERTYQSISILRHVYVGHVLS